jgi:hypothetical protein
MMKLLMLGFCRRAAVSCAASDRYNRQPIVVLAQTLFTVAGIGVRVCSIALNPPNVKRLRDKLVIQALSSVTA